jgi:inner membrane protein
MFNSTHTFVGFAIARTGLDKWVRNATATAVIASNLPDIDSVAGFWGTAAYLDHHRGVTHAFIGVPVLALLLSAVMCFFSGKFWRTYAVALIAMATHPALDYLNAYGLRPFSPWNGTWYYGDILFIIDPYLDAALVLGLIGGWLWPKRRRIVTLTWLFVAVVYIGVRIELRAMAMSQIQPLVTQLHGVEKSAVLPTMWNPRIWDVIAASQSGVLRFEACMPPCGIDSEIIPAMNSAPSSELVTRAATARSASALLRFARFPVTRVERLPSGYRVTFLDSRFYRESTNTALASEVILDESMSVIQDSLSFVHRIAGDRPARF